MQTRSQANEKEQQAPQVDAESPNLGADVLLNSLLLAHIWENLDANAKKQLRAVARGVRALADGLVVQLATHDKPAADLAAALARWPDVEVLAADCDDESGSVISAAPLPKLRMLSLEYSSEGYGDEFSVPSLSHTAAAGLQGLYVSRAHCMQPILLSIEALRGCAQLRTLVIEGGVLSDLSALAGCVHLEELTTGLEVGSDVSDLSPLGGCPKLKRLAVAGSQVTDLAPLRGCVELRSLIISHCRRLVSLEGLQACIELEFVDMYGCRSVTGLAGLPASLKCVDMGKCRAVTSIEPLSACVEMQRIGMVMCDCISSLDPLSGCIELRYLEMAGCRSLTSLDPLSSCVKLEEVGISGCLQLGSVAALCSCSRLVRINTDLKRRHDGMPALKAALPRLRISHNLR